jgi:hypothetical protein
MLITAELAVILTLLSLSLSLSSFEILAVAAKCVSFSLFHTHNTLFLSPFLHAQIISKEKDLFHILQNFT